MGVLGIAAAILTGCSLDRLATRTVADMVSGELGQAVFAGEEDPEFAAAALPFTIKLHEMLVAAEPEDAPLQLATARAYASYARGFIHVPATQIPNPEVARRAAEMARAKLHYLRGREHALGGLELRHPGFRERFAGGDLTGALELVDPSSIDYLYWLSAAWLGALATDPADLELVVTRHLVQAILELLLGWDETYGSGAIHELLLAYHAGLPENMGGSEARARAHFERAVALAGGARVTPYVNLAGTIAVRNQDPAEYRSLLEAALAVELDMPQWRLENVIMQRLARWYLDHIGDHFLEY